MSAYKPEDLRDTLHKKKISSVALCGPYPKPYGGISVHVKRLSEWLSNKGIICTVYDTSGISKKENNVVTIRSVWKWLLCLLLHGPEDVIHYHGYNPTLVGILSLLVTIKRSKLVVTFHSFRYDVDKMSLLEKFVFQLARKCKVNFVTVNQHIKEKVISLGINPENIKVIPAFIPPIIRKEEIAEIPRETWNFINKHTPIISANAFRITFYNNQDLYGIDMCIDLCANLKRDYPKIGFVFCLPDVGDYEYFSKMKQRIKESGIEENFFFQTKPCQFYPILMKSDLFVRPTNTDGDAVSLREALYFRVPSVASNAIPRPEGTILFKSRDIDDFILKVKDVLDNYEGHKERLESVILEDNAEKIIKIYQNLCK